MTEETRTIRRTRPMLRGRGRAEPSHTADIEKRMQSIALLQNEIQTRQDQITQLTAETESLMKQSNTTEFEHSGLVAAFVQTKSNDKREITPAELRKLMPKDKEFFECVKVQIGSLGTFFTEAEIAKMGELTVGKVTGTKFVIAQPKKKVGKSRS